MPDAQVDVIDDTSASNPCGQQRYLNPMRNIGARWTLTFAMRTTRNGGKPDCPRQGRLQGEC